MYTYSIYGNKKTTPQQASQEEKIPKKPTSASKTNFNPIRQSFSTVLVVELLYFDKTILFTVYHIEEDKAKVVAGQKWFLQYHSLAPDGAYSISRQYVGIL